MIDLRLADQRYKGFYIWKESNGSYSVGKNGTSKHITIKQHTQTACKESIIKYINEHY